MKKKDQYTLLSGNHAVSWAARLARPRVIPVYPITPQTPILEKISDFQAAGELDADILTPESEHSAMAACITASLTGVRVFTATASQGLMLMHELLHYAAGARAPIVMFNVNRTIGSPWGFWPDQTDSLAQRDTGWIQFYTESAQESLDTVILAYRVAEQVKLPAMINHEAFYVSHAIEPVNVPAQETVDEFLPPLVLEHMLDPEKGESFGYVCDQLTMRQSRVDLSDAMEKVIPAVDEAHAEWKRVTGRGYDIIEPYRCEDAELVVVTMGSMCGTIYDTVDALRDRGQKVGLLKIRLFRPFPVAAVRKVLAEVASVLVLDRNFSPGIGGVLHQEVRSALYGIEKAPALHGFLVGVGGVNVSPAKIEECVNAIKGKMPLNNSVWVE